MVSSVPSSSAPQPLGLTIFDQVGSIPILGFGMDTMKSSPSLPTWIPVPTILQSRITLEEWRRGLDRINLEVVKYYGIRPNIVACVLFITILLIIWQMAFTVAISYAAQVTVTFCTLMPFVLFTSLARYWNTQTDVLVDRACREVSTLWQQQGIRISLNKRYVRGGKSSTFTRELVVEVPLLLDARQSGATGFVPSAVPVPTSATRAELGFQDDQPTSIRGQPLSEFNLNLNQVRPRGSQAPSAVPAERHQQGVELSTLNPGQGTYDPRNVRSGLGSAGYSQPDLQAPRAPAAVADEESGTYQA